MTRYIEVVNPDLEHCCLHCGGNAGMDAHALDCPITTDIWPVTGREIDEDACCGSCDRPFELGEWYCGEFLRCLNCAATKPSAA